MENIRVKLENIEKTYVISQEMKQQVLKGVSFSVSTGEFLAIIGPSGSGKSTCMNILGCLDEASSGKYFLDGVNIDTLSSSELAHVRNKKIGFIFQNFNLISRKSVEENVGLPLMYRGEPKSVRREKSRVYLEKVGLAGYEKYKPSQLSGGMKQRVAIARALVSQPSIILADEPTGNLDSDTTEEILTLLKVLARDERITIIMITHERDVALQADRVVKIKNGVATEVSREDI